jgi:hypothetical protein
LALVYLFPAISNTKSRAYQKTMTISRIQRPVLGLGLLAVVAAARP